MDILINKLQRAFSLTQDLFEYLDESSLGLDLPDLPSNTIAGQVWCMVGARESYQKAVENEQWSGFSCSLKDATSKQEVLEALSRSSDAIQSLITESALSEKQLDFLFDLLEHEIQHHGQLIRYMYGNKLGFPQSWSDRYTV